MINPLKREPVVSIATAASVVSIVADAINGQGVDGSTVLNWHSLFVVVVTAIIRQLVISPKTLDKAVDVTISHTRLAASTKVDGALEEIYDVLDKAGVSVSQDTADAVQAIHDRVVADLAQSKPVAQP